MTQHQGRHFLHIPGPSPVPDRVLRAMDMPVIDHRSAQFAELGKKIFDGCQKVFKTAGPVIVFPSSGTGAWEAAIGNIAFDDVVAKPGQDLAVQGLFLPGLATEGFRGGVIGNQGFHG